MAENTQRVVWTPCPAGRTRDGKFLRINLHVSPRLVAGNPGDLVLGDFKAFVDWPATLAGAKFTVSGLTPGRPLGATIAERSDAEPFVPDSDIWRLLFPETTPVISHAFDDFRGRDVLTYPLAALANAIEETYAGLALEGPQLPPARGLARLPLFGGKKRHPPSLSDLLGVLRDTKTVEQLASQPSLMLDLLAAYHRPLAKPVKRIAKKRLKDGKPDPLDPHEDTIYRTVERVEMPELAEFRKNLDFHRVVSAIGQHPALMRLAGLVVPLLVAADGIDDGAKLVSVSVEWDKQGVETPEDVDCRVHAGLKGRQFIARAKTLLLIDGWLAAGHPSFDLVQLDVDGAGLTVKNLATQLPTMVEERFDDEEPRDPPPARVGAPRLRTAGIQFAQSRRDVAIRGLFDSAGGHDDTMNDAHPVELFAEDLIKGWRVDVLDATREASGTARGWQSLMRFDGAYRLTGDDRVVATDDEEAIARLAAAATADPAADAATKNVLKASEALFGWTGWSLAAPPPGRTMLPDYEEVDGEPMAELPGDAPNTVPPGLPLHTEFRAHPASLPVLRFGHAYQVRLRAADLAGWGPAYSSKPVELPVASPVVRFGRYEPVETPVLTVIDGDDAPSDGESMPRGALRTMVTASRNTVQVRRNIHPARVGHRFAELHGVIDGPEGTPRRDLYEALAGRDAAFEEDRTLTAPFPPGSPPTVPTSFTRSPQHGPTPYPADPLTGGVAIRVTGLGQRAPWENVLFVPFYARQWDPAKPLNWFKDESFAIVATEDGEPGWNPETREFVVPLAKAERARLFISAVVPDDGIKLLKLRELIIREHGETAWKKIEPIVRAGQHWMFTPNRMVELVHAVQKPLVVPSVEFISAQRPAGSVATDLSFRTPAHSKSTARIDIDGDWLEIDDSQPAGPVVRRVSAHAFDRKLYRLETEGNGLLSVSGSHVFADTRARRVTYRAIATTRFREYMPGDIREDPAALSVTSPAKTIWVPSASRPPAPAVRYLIPTFGWSRTGGTTGEQRSWRRGGGLRVYLDRPWFATGSNEMLAVCLPRTAADPQESPDKNYVTQWGADPAWLSGKIETVAPGPKDFLLRIKSGQTLPYAIAPDAAFEPESPAPDGVAMPDFSTGPYRPPGAPEGVEVNIVPHAVGYDSDRKLWYADIVVNPQEAYFPFIRLALARFQPSSVSTLDLSSVVLADFAQLTPDRLVVSTAGGLPTQRIIRVHGIAPTEWPGLPEASQFRAELQRLPVGADPDLGWIKTPEGPPPPPPLGGPGGIGGFGGLSTGNRSSTRIGGAFERIAREPAIKRLDRITAFDPATRARFVEAERLVEAGRFEEVLADPGMFELLRPPLLFEEALFLPLRANGERLRVLITEYETYATGPETQPSGEPVERIVFAEAVEV